MSGNYLFLTPPSSSTTVAGIRTTSVIPHTCDDLTDFKHGIKWDPSLFPEFHHEKQWDNVYRTFGAVARARDVFDVLRHDFTPTLAQ